MKIGKFACVSDSPLVVIVIIAWVRNPFYGFTLDLLASTSDFLAYPASAAYAEAI